MTGRIEKIASIYYHRARLLWESSIILFGVLFAACSSAATSTVQPITSVTNSETPPALPTLNPTTPTISFSFIPNIYPTLPSPPTARAYYWVQAGKLLKLLNIYMLDEQNGWAIERGENFNDILHTQDGGHTWRDVTPAYAYGIPRYSAHGFFALDANTAWAMTPENPPCDVQNWSCRLIPDTALVWHTTNGGRTWQGQFVTAIPYGSMPMSIQFLDTQVGWLLAMSFLDGGRQYHLYQTADGGTHWTEIMNASSSNAPEVLYGKDITAIAFQDSQAAWMSTDEVCCEEHLITVKEWNIYRSKNAGSTWEKFSLPAPDQLPATLLRNVAQCGAQDMQAIPPNVLETTFFCYIHEGDSRSYFYFHFHSGDGGNHWTSFQKTGVIQFIDSSLGWRMTPNEGAYDLERTQDGGANWTKLKTVHWIGRLNFVNKFVGWALVTLDNDVVFLHTVDGGRTWEEIKPILSAN